MRSLGRHLTVQSPIPQADWNEGWGGIERGMGWDQNEGWDGVLVEGWISQEKTDRFSTDLTQPNLVFN